MAVPSENRKAGPYAGSGSQSEFPFSFKLFKPNHIDVRVSDADSLTDESMSASAYSVTLNANQENSPGGVVRLVSPLPVGKVITILSSAPALQETVFTNQGGFYPEVLNRSLDQVVIYIQQLKEMVARQLTVPATSDRTPEEVMADLFQIAESADQFAAQARETYEAAKALADTVEGSVVGIGNTQVERVQAEGNTQVANVVSEGDKQAARLDAIADFEEAGVGVRCVERDWTVTTASAEGAQITLKDGMSYVVGRDQLHISVNGLELLKTENFEEVGTADMESSVVKFNMPLAIGDEVKAWTVPLGRGSTDELIERIKVLEDSLAQLSQTVVYKE